MKSKALAAVTAVLLSAAMGVTFAAPSYAGTTLRSQDKVAASPAIDAGPLCEGFGPCSVAPYTTHGYQDNYETSYWGFPAKQDVDPVSGVWANCTNYVAFVESTVYGVPAPKLPINATDWATGAQADGFTVNHTPTVGSVAQWYANDNKPVIGADGHVAIVEQVGPNDSYIVISQDNWHSDTDYYGWATIVNAPDAPNAEPWPDNFIHFFNGPATLSYSQPHRLIQSTGNLYWTANLTLQNRSTAVVYRASKTNEPGQEQILYQESNLPSSRADFEAITYANVGGSWYGYFVANYASFPSQHESQIKRVPLTGGAAVVLATSPAAIGNRDLVTDGSFLYWADAGGIRKMAITGGPVQTLLPGPSFAHLGLDGSVLYYSSGNSILTVPTSGGVSATVMTAPSAITALYPPSATQGVVWAGADGSVNRYDGGDIYNELQLPAAGVSVTSVSVAGNYILWTDCSAQGCQLDGDDNGGIVSMPISGNPVDVQGDAGGWYWSDSSGLEKFTL